MCRYPLRRGREQTHHLEEAFGKKQTKTQSANHKIPNKLVGGQDVGRLKLDAGALDLPELPRVGQRRTNEERSNQPDLGTGTEIGCGTEE